MIEDANGTLNTINLGGLVQVNETQKSTQNGQRVIVLEDGRILFSFNNGGLVWQSGVNARAASVTDDGSLVFDQEFRVSEPADFAPHNPEILELPDGRLLYSYIGFYDDGSGTSVIGRIGNLSVEGSVTFGNEFLINEHGYHNQYFQRMIELNDGRVLFAFETFSGVDGDDSFGGISARIGTVTSDNEVSFGEEFRVNEATELRQEDVQIVQLTDGRILFVYTSTISNPQHIVGRVGTPNPDGSLTFSDEVSLKDVGPQGQPKLTLLSDGQLLFSYALTQSQTQEAITRFLTVEDDGSISLGEKSVLNEHFYGLTSGLEIDTLPDGRILFVFRTSDPETNVEDNPHYNSKGGLVGQLVLPSGNGGLEVGDVFRLDPSWAGHQWDVQVTPISNDQLLLSFSTNQMTEEGSFTEDILTRVVKLNGLGTSSDDTLIAVSPGTLEGFEGNDILVGSSGADTISGGAGNDLIFGGGGDDEFIWKAGDGSDQIDGSAETIGDTIVILGNDDDEEFDIFSNAAATNDIDYQGAAEIVLVRNGFTITEIDEIEEIIVDGGGGENTFNISGSFSGTNLSTSTITLIGSSENDTVNAFELASPHRFVFIANGGNDEVFGDRNQDLIDVTGKTVTSVEEIEPGRFRVTLDDGSSITYSLAAMLVENAGTDAQVAVNLTPLAGDDTAATDEDTAIDVSIANGLLANDIDFDGGTLSITKIDGTDVEFGIAQSLASGATLVVNADGSYCYDPNGQFEALNAGQTSEDSFTYLLDDGQGGSVTAQVVIQISGVTDAGATVILGTPDNDVLEGTEANDTIRALAGDDLIKGGAGFDFIDGDEGLDSVEYKLARGDITLSSQADDSLLLGKPGGGTDTLIDVERIVLEDGNLLFDLLSQNLGFTYRIYAAGYGRTPDEGGLRYWTSVLDYFDANDPSVNKEKFLAQQFLKAEEFILLYGANSSNEDYIEAMYVNALKRLPDQGGYDFWVGEMEAGLGRDDILIAFAQSDENRNSTAPDLDDGVWVA